MREVSTERVKKDTRESCRPDSASFSLVGWNFCDGEMLYTLPQQVTTTPTHDNTSLIPEAMPRWLHSVFRR